MRVSYTTRTTVEVFNAAGEKVSSSVTTEEVIKQEVVLNGNIPNPNNSQKLMEEFDCDTCPAENLCEAIYVLEDAVEDASYALDILKNRLLKE